MKAPYAVILALAPFAVAACTETGPADRPAVSPAAKIVGEAENCIPLAQIRETRIRDDWTIDFISNGDRVWRNTLTSRCPGLKVNDGITYETSLTQLCNTDIVYVLETAGGLHRGPACGLGMFVPVELEKR